VCESHKLFNVYLYSCIGSVKIVMIARKCLVPTTERVPLSFARSFVPASLSTRNREWSGKFMLIRSVGELSALHVWVWRRWDDERRMANSHSQQHVRRTSVPYGHAESSAGDTDSKQRSTVSPSSHARCRDRYEELQWSLSRGWCRGLVFCRSACELDYLKILNGFPWTFWCKMVS